MCERTVRGWIKPSKGKDYAGVSEKVFRSWLTAGLRHVRLENGRILTKYDWIDEFLEKKEMQSEETRIAEQLVDSL